MDCLLQIHKSNVTVSLHRGRNRKGERKGRGESMSERESSIGHQELIRAEMRTMQLQKKRSLVFIRAELLNNDRPIVRPKQTGILLTRP